jgi:hypothetical protein
MSIKIEDFIKANKKEFDKEKPSAKLWEKIELELDKKTKKKRFDMRMWSGIAASVLLISGIALLYFFHGYKEQVSVDDVSSAYAVKQVRFSSLIEQKRDSLEIFADSNPDLYKKFSSDLEKLNHTYENLRKELPASPNQRLVVRAMIKNLEVQLQLVSQQLMIITQVSQYKKENSI